MSGMPSNPQRQLSGFPAQAARELAPPQPPQSSLPQERSEAKTERLASSKQDSPPSSSPQEKPSHMSEVEWLRLELQRQTEQSESLKESADELQVQLDALRKDFSAQSTDGQLEIRTLQSLLEKGHEQVEKLQTEMINQKKSNKGLKSQNLRLQYYLNVWGIPVSASGKEAQVPGSVGNSGRHFFPDLSALVDGLDPIPVVLRGDIYTFGFPNLLHFLANSNLTGVLTMVSDGVVSKLYLEKGILRLTGWNHTESELSLRNLLEQSDLVKANALDRYAGEFLYDLELAIALLKKEELPANLIQSGLREHARVILTYLYEVERGAFFFQPGVLRRQRYLQFNLPILDLLLVTAAEVDEKSRTHLP